MPPAGEGAQSRLATAESRTAGAGEKIPRHHNGGDIAAAQLPTDEVSLYTWQEMRRLAQTAD